MTAYTMRIETPLPYAEAVAQVRKALSEQGFGVLTEIDVRATMREKLGAEVPPQVILGACNPQLAHRALSASASTAALLPCNVSVRQDPGGGVVVEAIDPGVMARLESSPALAAISDEAGTRLRAALDVVVLQEA